MIRRGYVVSSSQKESGQVSYSHHSFEQRCWLGGWVVEYLLIYRACLISNEIIKGYIIMIR